ncbi:hypothetical protein KAR91_72060 [Candidatus Pacearchaeota archaeon]|nr:hypothetical protein [Candidatus Pacearchaeota archaeon]
MPQILLAFAVGGLFGVGLMAMMNIASSSDERLADFIMEAQHEAITRLHAGLVDLLAAATNPDWDMELYNGDNREFLTEITTLIESVNVEEHQNGTDN